MRAIVITDPGETDALRLVEVPIPEPRSGEVRIRVRAATVNPVDIGTRQGVFHELGWINQSAMTGLGWDVAGTVDAVGPDLAVPAVGTRVAAVLDRLDVPVGTYAEFVVVPAAALAEMPAAMSFAAASTVPLNALTADQALDLLDLPTGSTLLVTGAAGGVGGFALPLAVHRGLRVTGLARTGDRPFVCSTGAHLATALEGGEGFDGVLDAADLVEPAMAAVRDGGRYVGVTPARVPPGVRRIHADAVRIRHDGPRLAQLLALAADGVLALRVSRELPLRDARLAHDALERGGVRGRIVLVPEMGDTA